LKGLSFPDIPVEQEAPSKWLLVELNEIVTRFALATESSCPGRISLADAFMITEKVPKIRFGNERRSEWGYV